MFKIKLKKINGDARLPKKGREGDFCYDVWAVSEEEIAPDVWMYGLGFKYEIERPTSAHYTAFFDPFAKLNIFDDYDIAISMRPRSSIWETGMELVNSEGTLDEFYRGEAKAVFYHVMKNMPRYRKGDKVGQVYLSVAPKVSFEWADEINENTERGNGGFGSTGTK